MMPNGFTEIFEDEIYIVRYSGETPEIALNSALYFLTRDKSGPLVELQPEHVKVLQDAATERFSEIILRDIIPENIGTSIYRGIERTIVNYVRYLNFCVRQNIINILQNDLADQLLRFLAHVNKCLMEDKEDIQLDISFSELDSFCKEYLPENKQLGAVLLELETVLK